MELEEIKKNKGWLKRSIITVHSSNKQKLDPNNIIGNNI